nr:hypothetical protein [uncultured Sulfitobacter sp.]
MADEFSLLHRRRHENNENLRTVFRIRKTFAHELIVSVRWPLQLPISFRIRFRDAGSFDEVGEAGEAAPYGGGSRWRIGSAVGIASETRDGLDIELQVVRRLALSVRRCVFEQVALVIREDRSRVCSWPHG